MGITPCKDQLSGRKHSLMSKSQTNVHIYNTHWYILHELWRLLQDCVFNLPLFKGATTRACGLETRRLTSVIRFSSLSQTIHRSSGILPYLSLFRYVRDSFAVSFSYCVSIVCGSWITRNYIYTFLGDFWRSHWGVSCWSCGAVCILSWCCIFLG